MDEVVTMKLECTPILNLHEVIFEHHKDSRGFFTKSYQKTLFNLLHQPFEIVECFHSLSLKNTIRGMHYQSPQLNQFKLVFCVQGEIRDVVLDLRPKSPTYGNFYDRILNQDSQIGLLIPPGVAHGFCVTSTEPALVNYYSSSEYDPQHDLGVLWNSFGFNWNLSNPIISERDSKFITMAEYRAQHP